MELFLVQLVQITFATIYFLVPLALFILGIGALAKKLNPARPLWAYTYLILAPLLLSLSPIGVLGSGLSFFNIVHFLDSNNRLAAVISPLLRTVRYVYLFDLFLVIYLLVKILRFSAVPPSCGAAFTMNDIIKNTRHKLRYGAVAMITFGIFCVLPVFVIVLLLFLADQQVDILIRGLYYFYLIFLGLYLLGAAIAGAALALVLSISSVNLYTSLSMPLFEKRRLYTLLMFVPVVNVILLFRLSALPARISDTQETFYPPV